MIYNTYVDREPRYVNECCICDEPFERGYDCKSCGRPVCPGCVCLSPASERADLCPECEGAYIAVNFD